MIGKGGEGREATGEGGRGRREGALDMGSPSIETSSGSAPENAVDQF